MDAFDARAENSAISKTLLLPMPDAIARIRTPTRYRRTPAGTPIALSEGALYTASTDDESYFVIKVLRLGEGVPLIRIYSNTFRTRPQAVDESWLYVAEGRRQPGIPGAKCLTAQNELLRDWHLIPLQRCSSDRPRREHRSPALGDLRQFILMNKGWPPLS